MTEEIAGENPETLPPVQSESDDQVSDLATDSAEQGEHEEKTPEGYIKQERFNQVVGKKTAKQREAERKAERLEKELNELKSKYEQSELVDVNIPPAPDPYDDDFENKIRQRDEAIRKQAIVEARRQQQEQQTRAQQEAEQRRQEQQRLEKITKYERNAIANGVDLNELAQAEQIVNSYQIDPVLADHVMNDEHGALFVAYLAKNPLILDELTTMSPIQAAFKLDKEIRPKVSAKSKRVTAAPEPIENIRSTGTVEKESPFIQGARFE